MKVIIYQKYHHKNYESLINSIRILNWIIVYNIEDADIVFSASTYIDITKHPNKKFIFGPHFSVFPNNVVEKFNNQHKNAIYIQPSQPSVNTWINEFKFSKLPVYSYAFGVNTDKFKPSNTNRKQIFIYYKRRKPCELEYIISFLKNKNINYKLFSYTSSYNEIDYIKTLKESKYGIWIGSHESQGYALEEALSSNVPLLVWNVKLRIQEYGSEHIYKNVKSNVTTIPYWDDRCGMYFYKQEEFKDTYNKFISNLDTFKPREFILENLTFEKRAKELEKLVISI